ncbi:hypothetical protein [Pantoea brenneri]|uniref:Uncharacterized protein n=2 Tax=Pantoea TaxID=53335 RepID=A0ABU9MR43_9GAMM
MRIVDNAAKRVAAQNSPANDEIDDLDSDLIRDNSLRLGGDNELHGEGFDKPACTYKFNTEFDTIEIIKEQIYKDMSPEVLEEIYKIIKARAEENDKLIQQYEKKQKWKIFAHRYIPFCKFKENINDENVDEIFKIAYLKSQK